jgi:hypothetical protein
MRGNAAAEAPEHTFQTARLSVGRHDGPGAEVCVMELASMLAGERFSDRPQSVCPTIGALLRAYNDNLDERRRGELYRYAAEAVGTRGSFRLQLRRAEVALAWAHAGYRQRARRWQGLKQPERAPDSDWGPDQIAVYVIRSLGRRRRRGAAECAAWSESAHASMLWLLDRLIEMSVDEPVEHRRQPVEHVGGDTQLLVAELGECGAPAGLEPRPALADEGLAALGQRRQHDALVAL